MGACEESSSRLLSVQRQIEEAARMSGRDPAGVKLVAITKGVSIPNIESVYACGQRLFGESYVQEALTKIPTLKANCPEAEFHFVGRLQRNKVAHVVGQFTLIHSVDRIELAAEIQKNAGRLGIRQPVLIQINLSEEPKKGGVARSELTDLYKQLSQLPALHVRGLMLIGSPDPTRGRAEFRELRLLRDGLEAEFHTKLPELSMGMSHDFGAAISEGATIVRVGTAIFGLRGANE